ncbi:MAG: TIGR04283 family arsenosugar biosynthesis glycosyltransferase [Betaproteobacteria bacterium]
MTPSGDALPTGSPIRSSPVLVSIIIPTLDEAVGIGTRLRALQPLRERGHEVIVADGGSADGTAELALPLVDRVIASPRGRALQMNAGAAEARGEVLIFLHADTLLPDMPDLLVTGALTESRRAWGRFDVRIDGHHPMLPVIAFLMNLRSRLSGIATGDQAMFVTRDAFVRTGGFPAIALMEDIALSSRLRRISRPASLRARVITSGRRWEKHGVARTILLMWRLRIAYFLGVAPTRLAERYLPHES